MINPKLKVYIAGPMRGIQYFNFPAFDAAAARLRELGYVVISPAEMDRAHGFDPTKLPADRDWNDLGDFDLNDALRRDFRAITRCDAICFLRGFEKSKGAQMEQKVASFLGLVELYYDDLAGVVWPLDEWLEAVDYARDISRPHQALDHLVLNPDYDYSRLRKLLETPSILEGEERVTDPDTGGQKGRKLERCDLLPVLPLLEVARLYGKGAQKYADRNWEKGYAWSLSYGALLRHAFAFWAGEDNDRETGCNHMASVVFHALALIQFGITHPDKDDRPHTNPELGHRLAVAAEDALK